MSVDVLQLFLTGMLRAGRDTHEAQQAAGHAGKAFKGTGPAGLLWGLKQAQVLFRADLDLDVLWDSELAAMFRPAEVTGEGADRAGSHACHFEHGSVLSSWPAAG